jgi:hypothetical protein
MRTSFNIRGVLAVAAITAGASWLGTGDALAAATAGASRLGTGSVATAGASRLGAGSAVANRFGTGRAVANRFGTGRGVPAAPCEDDPLASAQSPSAAPHGCEPLGDLPVPHMAGHGARPGSGDLLIAIERVKGGSGLPSGTTAVVGLTDLPAIVRSTGLPDFMRGEFVYSVTRGRILPGVIRYDGRPASRTASVLPMEPVTIPLTSAGTTAPSATSAPEVPGITGAAHRTRTVEQSAATVAKPGGAGDDVVSAEVERLPSVDTALTDLHVR